MMIYSAGFIDTNNLIYPARSPPPPLIRNSWDWRKKEKNQQDKIGIKRLEINNQRKLEETPELILDAPGLIDDFYSSPIDCYQSETFGVESNACGIENNSYGIESKLAVALLSSIYIYSIEQKRLCQLQNEKNSKNVSSVKWISSHVLASGQGNSLQVWDTTSLQIIYEQKTNNNRLVALESLDENVIITGSERGQILLFDIRASSTSVLGSGIQHSSIPNTKIHSQEVCGLSMTPKTTIPLLASGSNDNSIGVWDLRKIFMPIFKMTHHTSAVKVNNINLKCNN